MELTQEHSMEAAPSHPAPKLSRPSDHMALETAMATRLPPSSPGCNNEGRSPAKLRRTPSASSLTSSHSARASLPKKASYNSLRSPGAQTPPRSPVALSRRASSNLVTLGEDARSTAMASSLLAEPPAAPTAAEVGREYLQRDLQRHAELADAPVPATVILHDACYGHRYARPRTSKAALSTVVERPERLRAALLGIAAAYVRLGGRHSGAPGAPDDAPHPSQQQPWPGRVPFTVRKSTRALSLVAPAVTQVHGSKWMAELKAMCEGAESRLALTGKELARPAGAARDGGPEKRLHEGDLYLCAESLDALEGALGGVADAVDAVFAAFGPSRAFACVRPPGHHCSADYPSGFCWINNVHAGIAHAATTHGLTHAAIIDFDLHHGDGSQTITWDHNARLATLPKNAPMAKKYAVGYFSIHDINSYPCEMGDKEKVQNASLCMENAHNQTIWNVHLQPWKNLEDFWELYETRYLILIDKMRSFLRVQNDRLHAQTPARTPKAAIFVSAGLDASEWEGAGMQRHNVNVPTEFYARFTRDIAKLSAEPGLAVDGRIVSVLEGGYSDRALTSGILSHLCGLVTPQDVTQASSDADGLAHEMSTRMAHLEINGQGGESRSTQEAPESFPFDPSWWAPSCLEELERLVNPPPAPAPKKPRGPTNPTYTTPTQASVAKAVSPSAIRRSMSGSLLNGSTPASPGPPRAAPLPAVGWDVAAVELAGLLTPTDRSTGSCRPEDLNAEATRARKSRQSAAASVTAPPPDGDARMQLRDRRAKAPAAAAASAAADGRPTSRATANRRRTVSSTAEILDLDARAQSQGDGKVSTAARRRVSAASTLASIADDAGPDHAGPKDAAGGAAAPNLPPKPRVGRKPGPKLSPIGAPSRSRPASRGKAETGKPAIAQPTRPTSTEPGVDALASGVKKMSIKLHVPPREEQERREAERKAAPAERKAPPAKPAAAKVARKSAVPKAAAPRALAARPLAPKPTATAAAAPQPQVAAQASAPLPPSESPHPATIDGGLEAQVPAGPSPEAPLVNAAVRPPSSAGLGSQLLPAAAAPPAPMPAGIDPPRPAPNGPGSAGADLPRNPIAMANNAHARVFKPGSDIVFGPSGAINDENRRPSEARPGSSAQDVKMEE